MDSEKYKKANIATNMAYSVAEAANSFAVDADSELRKLGSYLKHEEKHKFKLMIEAAEKLKKHIKVCCKTIIWHTRFRNGIKRFRLAICVFKITN